MLARKALAGTAGAPKEYVEDVFSTDLFVGNSSSQTVTNNIDLSGDGGLVWLKNRGPGTDSHRLFDTARTLGYYINTNSTDAQATDSGRDLTAYSSTGYTLNVSDFNTDDIWVSWTFRKAEKFFDVVTYTGDGTQSRAINHSLGSTPGCIIVKCSSTGGTTWFVWHRSINGGNGRLKLASTDAATSPDDGAVWGNSSTSTYVAPTSTTFTVSSNISVNNSGDTYVAYLFAHDAGGFGDAGSDNVISCGSFTTNGSGAATVTLDWEPQWLLVKASSTSEDWNIGDNMRGMPNGDTAQTTGLKWLKANNTGAEAGQNTNNWYPTATGFKVTDIGYNNATFIYIAIRRGPMKTPTTGTSVFSPLAYTGNGTSGRYISGAGFPPDLIIQTARSSSENREFDDRLRGGGSTAMNALLSNSTNAEATDSGSVQLLNQDGFTVRSFGNGSSVTYIGECFRRAPGFFDQVCYTGNGTSGRTVTHNLGVTPELMIVKARTTATGNNNWVIYAAGRGATEGAYFTDAAFQATTSFWNDTAPTSSVFSLGNANAVNQNTITYVAYLFASLAGVSKVGSYTGTGSTQTINCGFTAGSRFVMIKRTDSTGDWYVWDSARGIVSGNDPYLLLNSTAAEVTNTDYIDTANSGFEISSTAPAAINANGGTFIFFAVA
jgi:hypothetical protein